MARKENLKKSYPVPANELARLEALHRYHILDTPEEEAFDRLTRLATRMLNVPIALVSLIETDRQWFKSAVGYPVKETKRSLSFCTHAICGSGILCVPDARLDTRFAHNPLVTDDPKIRFYAGAPLTAYDGHKIGTFCVIDTIPHADFTREAQKTLEDLATVAMALIEQRIEQGLRKVAERNALEKAREAEEATRRFEETLDTISQGLVVFDAEFKLRFANRALLKLQNLPPEYRKHGRPFADFIRYHVELGEFGRNANAEEHIERLARLAKNPQGSVMIIRRKNGRVIEIRTLPLSDGGFVTTHTDITAMKEAERMKDEFISTVSHELRTPLAAISGALSLMEVEPLSERAARLRHIAATNAAGLAGLVNDVLDIERLMLGRMTLNKRTFDLADLARQSIEALMPYAEKYNVDFVLAPADASLEICADAERISQVLTNLLSNAAKFSVPGRSVTLSFEKRGDYARVSVVDRGSGIPENFKARIFEKFSQAIESDAHKGGAGLGLHIARMLVEAHKGRIGYEDRPGGGTIFWFELPVREQRTVKDYRSI
jgi:signal transduction histidine kinase